MLLFPLVLKHCSASSMTTDPKHPDLCKIIIVCRRKSEHDEAHLNDSQFNTWLKATLHQTNKVIGRTYVLDTLHLPRGNYWSSVDSWLPIFGFSFYCDINLGCIYMDVIIINGYYTNSYYEVCSMNDTDVTFYCLCHQNMYKLFLKISRFFTFVKMQIRIKFK